MRQSQMFTSVPRWNMRRLSADETPAVPVRQNDVRITVHGRNAYVWGHLREDVGMRRASLQPKMS